MTSTPRAEDVIWIASYPKSGNTWVQSVVREAGRPYRFPTEDLDVYKLIADKRSPQVVRGIRPKVTTAPATVLKTHAVFPEDGVVHPPLSLRTAGFVYVMRNPLDMLLSYINFTRQQYEKRQDSDQYRQRLFIDLLGFDRALPFDEWRQMTLEDLPRDRLDHALARFTESRTGIPGLAGMAGGTWLAHCTSWREAGRRLPSVFLRYEDLLDDPSKFLGLKELFQFPDDQIQRAVEVVNERQRGMQYKVVFFNKMASYYYREFFSAAQIDRFVDALGPELKALGYGNLKSKAV